MKFPGHVWIQEYISKFLSASIYLFRTWLDHCVVLKLGIGGGLRSPCASDL